MKPVDLVLDVCWRLCEKMVHKWSLCVQEASGDQHHGLISHAFMHHRSFKSQAVGISVGKQQSICMCFHGDSN
jgi:hypothetical protein